MNQRALHELVPPYKMKLSESSGGVQPNLNLSIVKRVAIPLPSLAEQTRIVAEVERRLSVVEELEAVVSANLQSILQSAFTGELV